MHERLLVKQLLLTENFWTLSKPLVKLFGIETAFVLSNLAEAEKMMADKDGWFYQTADTLEKYTGLSRYKQDQAIDQLTDAKVLIKDVRGIPAKRYFKFDYEELSNQFANYLQTSNQEIDKQEFQKVGTNKESTIKKVNKESTKYVQETKEPEPEPEPEIEEKKEKKKPRRENKFSDTQMAIAKLLWREVKTNFPNRKEPNLESWANDIRLMMERDKRTAEEIKAAIVWSQNNEFWYANILSTSKLRRQYDTLYAQADREGKNFTPEDAEHKYSFKKEPEKEDEWAGFDYWNS